MEDINFEFDDDLKKRAQKIIEQEPKLDHIKLDKVCFTKIDKTLKGGHILGICVLLGFRTEFLSGKRFMIEMPPVYYELNEKQKDIVMEHELMHISKNNKRLVEHNIGEFKIIVEKYGLDWFEAFKKGELLLAKKKLKEAENKYKKVED
mgnify:FL=1